MDNKPSVTTTIGLANDDYGLLLPILVACVVCAIISLLWLFLNRRKRKNVLLVGISDSGKTTLFSRLVQDTNVTSFTSIQENVAPFTSTKEVIAHLFLLSA